MLPSSAYFVSIGSPETSVPIWQATRRHIPESHNIVACFLVTRRVTSGNSIYLDFHLAELQLFVTRSYTT
jgi:hypothetical protein